MKKLTSFTELTTGEGSRIAYTYSEIDEDGNLIAQNKKGNFVVVNSDVQEAITLIRAFITERHLSD